MNETSPADPGPEVLLLTVEQAAHRLNISRTRAFQLVRSGELRSIAIGRLRRVPAAAVAEFANQSEVA